MTYVINEHMSNIEICMAGDCSKLCDYHISVGYLTRYLLQTLLYNFARYLHPSYLLVLVISPPLYLFYTCVTDSFVYFNLFIVF